MRENTAVFAIFDRYTDVENAVDDLKSANFRDTDISVLFSDNQGTKDFAHKKATKAPEGATTGAATGAVIGGSLGWLAGIGSLAIPGVGPLIAAGPIMAALAGAGVGGAVGSITGALVGMGIPEYEAKRYEGIVKGGGILMSVHCDNSEYIKRAKEILKANNGKDISSAKESGDVEEGTASDKPYSRYDDDKLGRDKDSLVS